MIITIDDVLALGSLVDVLRNDELTIDDRVGIGSLKLPEIRWWYADRVVRLHVPVVLRAAGMDKEADQLEALPEIVDEGSAVSAHFAVMEVDRGGRRAFRWAIGAIVHATSPTPDAAVAASYSAYVSRECAVVDGGVRGRAESLAQLEELIRRAESAKS